MAPHGHDHPPLNVIRIMYLVASWFNLVLYTTEWALYGVYVCKFPRDRKIHRGVVHAALVSDTVATAVVCFGAYLVLLASEDLTDRLIWTIPCLIFTNSISSAVEHSFLTYRIWHLQMFNNSTTTRTPMSLFKLLWPTVSLSLLTLLHLIVSTISAVSVIVRPASLQGFGSISAAVGGSLRAASDLIIAVFLVYQVRKFETSFVSTKSFMKQFTVKVLATGALAAVFTVLIILLLFLNHIVAIVFTSTVGRVHSITTLAHLCSRKAVPRTDCNISTSECVLSTLDFDARVEGEVPTSTH